MALSGIVGSILGLYYRIYMDQEKTADSGWYSSAAFITVCVELFITIIVSCVPACVSNYKNYLRDSRLVNSLKSLLHSSKASSGWRSTKSEKSKISTESNSVHLVHRNEKSSFTQDSEGLDFITVPVEERQA